MSLSSLWSYLRARKRYWLLPMLTLVALLLLLLALTRDSPESFVYTLF